MSFAVYLKVLPCVSTIIEALLKYELSTAKNLGSAVASLAGTECIFCFRLQSPPGLIKYYLLHEASPKRRKGDPRYFCCPRRQSRLGPVNYRSMRISVSTVGGIDKTPVRERWRVLYIVGHETIRIG